MKVVILASELPIYFYLFALGIFPMYRNLEQTRYYTLFINIYP